MMENITNASQTMKSCILKTNSSRKRKKLFPRFTSSIQTLSHTKIKSTSLNSFEQHNQNKVFATLRSVSGIQNEVDVAHLKVVILFKGQVIYPKFLVK
jgi:hypothetical protein